MTTVEKEKELLEHIKEGNQESFIELVEPFKDRLYRKALSMVKDEDDAEDILQDALIAGYKSIQNFRSDSGVYTWFYRIVINKAKDFLSKKRRGKENSIEENEFQFTDQRVGFEKKIELSDESSYLIRKIYELDETYSQVLELRYFEELSYSQIAEVLGCNIGTVKSRIFKAKEMLKYLISKDQRSEGYFK